MVHTIGSVTTKALGLGVSVLRTTAGAWMAGGRARASESAASAAQLRMPNRGGPTPNAFNWHRALDVANRKPSCALSRFFHVLQFGCMLVLKKQHSE